FEHGVDVMVENRRDHPRITCARTSKQRAALDGILCGLNFSCESMSLWFLTPNGQQVTDANEVVLEHLHEHLLVEPIQLSLIGYPGIGEGLAHLHLEGLDELEENAEVLIHGVMRWEPDGVVDHVGDTLALLEPGQSHEPLQHGGNPQASAADVEAVPG